MTAGRLCAVASLARGLRPRPGLRGERAFTLVELLLAISLILLLMGAMVFNFATLQRGVQLEEGASQVEALIQYARAQASSTGRRVQLEYSELPGEMAIDSHPVIRLLWERDPFGAPGIFEELPGSAAYVRGILDVVRFESALPPDTGSSTAHASQQSGPPPASATNSPLGMPPTFGSGGTNNMAAGGDMAAGRPFQPVVFYPDGSCDPIRLVLVSQDGEDERRLALDLSGLTPEVTRRFLPRDGTPARDASEHTTDSAPAEEPGDTPGEAPPP